MSARAYTMKEMRSIVDYLVERKAYSEIRGRKMWMVFASSGVTTRSWQSLKETFLKRILPDIHNPYYKLSPETIRSFREGKDVANKIRNKLEFQDSKDEAEAVNPSTCTNVGENGTGEDIICSNLHNSNRASTETIILKHTDDIDDHDEGNQSDNNKKKSLRDCITFTEPLTPMLQEIFHDFESDDEDVAVIEKDTNKERLAQELSSEKSNVIDLIEKLTDSSNDFQKKAKATENTTSTKTTENIASSKSDKSPKKSEVDIVEVSNENKNTVEDNVASKDVAQKSEENKFNKDNSKTNTFAEKKRNLRNRKSSVLEESHVTITDSHTSEVNNSVPDSLLPNNQEGLINTLNVTETSKPCSNSPAKLQENAKTPPKDQEESKTSKTQEITKKKLKTTPNKKKDSTGQTEDTEHEIEKSISKDDSVPKVPTVNSVDNENHINASQSVERTESDIPNNLDEPETKISGKCAPETRVDKVNQAEVIAEKGDDIVSEVLSSKSQPPSNPCLQSVILYDENLPGYSSNSSDLILAETPETNTVVKKEGEDDIVLFLASNSDGDGLLAASPPPPPKTNIVKRKRLLNNLFSKKKDVVKPKRRRYNSLRANLPPVNQKKSDSSSSWSSSESDSTSVSRTPSRSRRRHTKKYIKPVSSKLFSLGGSGALFAASHNKIYPLIYDHKGSKVLLDHIPEEDSAEEEAEYWKLKYVEECKKTAELKKLCEELKGSTSKMRLTLPSNSPILPSGSKKINVTVENNLVNDDDEVPKVIIAKQVEKPEPKEEDKTVKIKYAKHDEAISLEGQWLNVKVILQDVMQLINKDRSGGDVIVVDKPARASAAAPARVSISGTTTPDEDVRRRVNDLEDSIMQEIEEMNKLEEMNEQKLAENTKRRGRPKKREAPSSPQQRVEQKTRRSNHKLEVANGDNNDPDIIVNEAKLKPVDDEIASGPAQKTLRTNKRNAARVQASKQNISKEVEADEDSEILYKFPSPKRTTHANNTINIDEEFKNTKKPSPKLKLPVPLSPESTQGYQDSVDGPMFKVTKKKKPLSTIDHRNKSRRNNRRQSYEYSNTDASNECSNSLPSAPQKMSKTENSTFKTEAFISESYQMLMPMTKQNVAAIMDQIQEASPCPNEMDSVADIHSLNLSPASQNIDFKRDKSSSSISIHINTEPASSSSVSLPMSPELSIVENISFSKSNFHIGEQPTINELQANEDSLSLTCDKFELSQVDVTMPLMEQQCHLRTTDIKDRSSEISYELRSARTCDEETVNDLDLDINSNKRGTTVSDSLLSKLDTVNIEDNPSFVTSLDGHMKDLLLESAKKAKPTRKFLKDKENTCFNEKMEVDIDNVNGNEPKNKTKQKKRCSTPRKRQNIVKSQPLVIVDGVIEEETVEFCASGRKSCPPVFSSIADSQNNNAISHISKSPDNVTVRKPKKTKEIIKVKILRPKPKKSINKAKQAESGRMSKMSARTDSGINDTTCSHSLNLNETVELIHNHSETCLQASECFDNVSVQILSPSRSIISLTTSSLECEDSLGRVSVVSQESSGLPPEMYCSKARDGTVAIKPKTEVKQSSQSSANECYHTLPASVSSLNSLITEDLSSEITSKQKSDWFLLSDEDATNTVSNIEPAPNTVETSLCNAYLKRLFPVTVAVPDLSTITEASKDTNSQSRQNPTRDTTETIDLFCSEHLSDDFSSCQS